MTYFIRARVDGPLEGGVKLVAGSKSEALAKAKEFRDLWVEVEVTDGNGNDIELPSQTK